jgi:hypothetical protein
LKRRVVTTLLVGTLLLAACRGSSESQVEQAEFGVFFGGQVQELKEITKELDPTRQRHGFRIRFRQPLPRDVPVHWELLLPQSEKGGPRAAQLGQVTAKAGETELDVPLGFRPTDPLGVWHAQLSIDGKSVVARDFTLVAPPPPPRTSPKPLPPRAPGPSPSL